MTDLKALRADFIKTLNSYYDKEEIINFFSWLAEDILELKTHQLLLNKEVNLDENKLAKFKSATERLQRQEPIQHILGYTEFFGLKIKVDSSVLIPRPETEELVQWVIDDYSAKNHQFSLIDLGTGSGCIPIALARQLPQAKIKALDVSKEALSLAAINSKENNVEIELIEEDILELEYLQEVDVLVSNPPYVKYDEQEGMSNNVLKNEPHVALFVYDDDPLVFYRKIAELSLKQKKRPVIYVEVSQYLANETRDLFINYGFDQVELRKDFRGNDRMLKAY
ncbi:peptide chain release factor N(5)-glutamine methyltransferase [Psychroflexus tropicus]|uniref:peptide chain release factor N(5)-glutamine methyltransferase n=1 Tax=Psychroflexus tropicus TaxID=197345 RepID=UPI00037A2DCA|nr:peptide chain release factor N(5)-glutamine methyltransferase [Psychroflexus tropicus]